MSDRFQEVHIELQRTLTPEQMALVGLAINLAQRYGYQAGQREGVRMMAEDVIALAAENLWRATGGVAQARSYPRSSSARRDWPRIARKIRRTNNDAVLTTAA